MAETLATSASTTSASTTSAGATSADTPPDSDGWRGGAGGGLAALRAELDRIDDALHGLLMERARVVEQVARSGKPAAFRPGREASIIRRLLARHTGRLPPVTLSRLWRELMAGTTAMQGRFVIAVGGGGDVAQLAREHFGALTPLLVQPGSAQALEAVRDGSAAVAVAPLLSTPDPWWTSLGCRPGLHIIARLPFWATRPMGAVTTEAFVIATTPPDPSGDDCTCVVFAVAPGLARAGIEAALSAAGLQGAVLAMAGGSGNGEGSVLVQVAGLIGADDARLAAAGPSLRRAVVIGGYAVPVGAQALPVSIPPSAAALRNPATAQAGRGDQLA